MKCKILKFIAKLIPKKLLAYCVQRAWEIASERYEALDIDELDWRAVRDFLDKGE